jgi:hypothetical protein
MRSAMKLRTQYCTESDRTVPYGRIANFFLGNMKAQYAVRKIRNIPTSELVVERAGKLSGIPHTVGSWLSP